MKTPASLSRIFGLLLSALLVSTFLNSQTSKPTLAVTDVDANEAYPLATQRSLSEMARLEMERIGFWEILDRYDMAFLAKRDDLSVSGCYSKICLIEIGKQLHVDKLLTGSVMTVGDQIYVTFKLLDVNSGMIEKSKTNEFLNIPTEVKNMIRITVNDLFGFSNDQDIVSKLTLRNEFENTLNNPYELRLKTDGPRMGFTVFEGALAQRLHEPESVGGFNAGPLMFQFGYQFEKQYLNEGNFQALFEFIPLVTGLDQGLVIPSFTIMNGLRNNKNGWEFAFGPTFSLIKKANGFYHPETGAWTLTSDSVMAPQGTSAFRRLDSRGELALQSGFVFAFGKTFRSGKLNIPVNGYVIPNRDGFRLGLSFGFNGKERYAYHSKIAR